MTIASSPSDEDIELPPDDVCDVLARCWRPDDDSCRRHLARGDA